MTQEDISDEQWYTNAIKTAQCIERLEYLAMNIDYDKWESVGYTASLDIMNRLRTAWKARHDELSGQQKEVPQ